MLKVFAYIAFLMMVIFVTAAFSDIGEEGNNPAAWLFGAILCAILIYIFDKQPKGG